MGMNRNKTEEQLIDHTDGAVRRLIGQNDLDIYLPKDTESQTKKTDKKLITIRADAQLREDFAWYCKSIGSDTSKEITNFIETCVDANRDAVQKFKTQVKK